MSKTEFPELRKHLADMTQEIEEDKKEGSDELDIFTVALRDEIDEILILAGRYDQAHAENAKLHKELAEAKNALAEAQQRIARERQAAISIGVAVLNTGVVKKGTKGTVEAVQQLRDAFEDARAKLAQAERLIQIAGPLHSSLGDLLDAITEAQMHGTVDTPVIQAAGHTSYILQALRQRQHEQHMSTKPFPTIVCLCGSTKFWRTFQRASLDETMAGRIVLSIGAATGTDDEHFGNLTPEEYDRIKADLDELHKRKIDLADEVLILNDTLPYCPRCGDYVHYTACAVMHEPLEQRPYIGDSTRSELEYAMAHGKRVRWLNPPETPPCNSSTAPPRASASS